MRLARHLPRFREAIRNLPRLEARESWSRNEIESFQLERLNSLWREAIVHVPYYRKLRHEQCLPERFHSLEEYAQTVPITQRSDTRAHPLHFLSERAAAGNWRLTSGSTGIPIHIFWPHEATRESLQYRYRLFAEWGVDIFDRQAMLWGDGGESHHRGIRRTLVRVRRSVLDRLRNRVRFSAFRIEPHDLHHYLRRMQETRPASLYAYSTAAYLLSQEAQKLQWSCPSLKVAILSAEAASPSVMRSVEQGLGVPAIQEYGSIECGPIAFTGRDRRFRVRDDGILLETIPRADRRYDIVVTPLHNRSFPLFRYQIGDVTDSPLHRPLQGFSQLTNVAGRSNDLLVTGTGRKLHWIQLDCMLEAIPDVRLYRAHQHSDGRLSVLLQPSTRNEWPDTSRVQQNVAPLMEGLPVEVKVVDSIPAGPNGKHKWIISDCISESPPADFRSPAIN